MRAEPRNAFRLSIPAFGLALTVASPAPAQNTSSFLDAGDSAVRYTATPARPVMACQDLLGLTGHEFAIVSARSVPADGEVPGHCRVDGVIPQEIRFQVNLPDAWNRRFYMHGNGGYAGEQPEDPSRTWYRDAALAHGFATAFTDTGHDGGAEPLATFAYNDPAKEIDYAFRAVHLTVGVAKGLIGRFYGRPPAYSYWDGCSTGGRQGLMSAQRFPADFDGIVAGAPVLDFTGTQIWGVWNARALAGAPPLSQAQMATVADVVYARCDALDGVRDGLIEDPRRCDFDPARHLPQCAGGGPGERCFAPAQIEALGKVYGGVESRGEVILPGLPVGAERRGWEGWLIAAEGPSAQLLFGETFLKYLAFEEDDPDYDWRTFDFDADPERMQAIRTLLDATDPDLAGFAGRGGRMITYFGWADPALNPLMAVDYYEAVRATMGADETSDVYRLFMVPGMLHCRGGHGVDRIDGMSALIDWVENGVAPDRLIGARVVDDRVVRTRPLCPYPQVATYRGSGSIDEAGSFACADPEP